ncbi:MAG: hypothetical protein ABIU20_07740 [Blastocatellia bacterium]
MNKGLWEDYYLISARLGDLWKKLGEAEKAADNLCQALRCPCSKPQVTLSAKETRCGYQSIRSQKN